MKCSSIEAMRTLAVLTVVCCALGFAQPARRSFSLGNEQFLLDGKPFQIISGEMHFARIPHQYWRHRLRMAKAMGLNTIATYVFWNYHELRPGEFDFSTENRNIREFIKTAQEEGLFVLLRPGPYACAEWEFGGYPWWLLEDSTVVVRGMDQRFLDASARYLDRLGQEVKDLQVTRGGPILMVQVENEYGSFGSDSAYMGKVRDMVRHAGFDVPLNRADGPSQCKAGSAAGLLPSIDGEDNPVSLRDTVRKYHEGNGPFFVSEFYPGWLDNWGLNHSIVPANDFIRQYDTLLQAGCSVSLYVVHGGTNFGFMNGANYDREHPILPQPTTYDYDAPIDEAGRATEKYFILRETIQKHLPPGAKIPDLPPAPTVVAVPPFALSGSIQLEELLANPVHSDRTLSFEDLGQGYGFLLYRSAIPGVPAGRPVLKIDGLRDYAVVLVNGKRVGTIDRRLDQDSLALPSAPAGGIIDLLVENLGRINYGGKMVENRKGVLYGASINGSPLGPWEHYPLALDADPANTVPPKPAESTVTAPCIRTGGFVVEHIGEMFLDMSGWGKGVVWVNGHSAGRYWNIGPQQSLYIPGCWLKEGKNSVTVLELINDSANTLRGLPAPVLNRLREATVEMSVVADSVATRWKVSMETSDSTDTIFYTLDGSTPDASSSVYRAPLMLDTGAVVSARAMREGFLSEPVAKCEIVRSRSTWRDICYDSACTAKYPAGGRRALVDGLTGSLNFRDGRWQGFQGSGLGVTLDLGSTQRIDSVSIAFLQDAGSWIFQPRRVTIEYSVDGANYMPFASRNPGEPANRQGAFVVRYGGKLLESRSARYVRVTAENIGFCPPWHPGKGGKCWIFADELIVR